MFYNLKEILENEDIYDKEKDSIYVQIDLKVGDFKIVKNKQNKLIVGRMIRRN